MNDLQVILHKLLEKNPVDILVGCRAPPDFNIYRYYSLLNFLDKEDPYLKKFFNRDQALKALSTAKTIIIKSFFREHTVVNLNQDNEFFQRSYLWNFDEQGSFYCITTIIYY
ncbi:MAG: hypothetical protein ACKO96_34955 [Flammeovirgaceae bacterium]